MCVDFGHDELKETVHAEGCPDVLNVEYPQETTANKMDVLGEFALFQQGNEDVA